MNILFISYDPKECVDFIDDGLIPMIVAQTTTILNDALFSKLYPEFIEGQSNLVFAQSAGIASPKNLNHPCVEWTAASYEHYDWLFRYWCYLQDAHKEKFGFFHETYPRIERFARFEQIFLKRDSFVAPPNLAVDEAHRIDFRGIEDTCQAYKLFIHAQQRHLNSTPPEPADLTVNW